MPFWDNYAFVSELLTSETELKFVRIEYDFNYQVSIILFSALKLILKILRVFRFNFMLLVLKLCRTFLIANSVFSYFLLLITVF